MNKYFNVENIFVFGAICAIVVCVILFLKKKGDIA